jgi:uncharacterized membrane protein
MSKQHRIVKLSSQEFLMPKRSKRLIPVLLILLIVQFLSIPVHAQENEEQPVVRAVLFYSPTCGHCEKVIQTDLPPLLAQYGDQLKIVAINVSFPEGQTLYQATVERFDIPDNRRGVPLMVVEEVVMVGGSEVPSKFPELVTNAMTEGGTDWPDIPGLAEVIADVKFSSKPTGNPQVNETGDENPPLLAKFLMDPVANSIAVIVLVGMIASIVGAIISFTRPLPEKDFWPKWVIPVLSIFGMGVAFYLTYVETSGAEAVCGPVGDCNTVQFSPYAVLFGVLPVGLLGLIGYALILAGWALYHFGPQSLRWASAISVWGMAFFGILFSIYLTFLEPFVIGATCMWCITSAIIMTIVFLAATGPAKRAWQEDDFDDEDFDDEEDNTIPSTEDDKSDSTEVGISGEETESTYEATDDTNSNTEDTKDEGGLPNGEE